MAAVSPGMLTPSPGFAVFDDALATALPIAASPFTRDFFLLQKPSFPTFGELPKCYLPGCRPSDLSPRWAGKLEILAEPMHDLSCCLPLPAPAATAEPEGNPCC